MTKIRDFIEKIWWVIPLIIVISIAPFLLAIKDMLQFSQPLSAFFLNFVKYLYVFNFMFMAENFILLLFFVGFMGFGYCLVRKNPSLFLRIIIPIILAGIGFSVVVYYGMMLSAH